MNEAQERWDACYRDNRLPWNINKPASELTRIVERGEPAPGRALELGCGIGNDALYLAERGFTVTAVDLSPTAIETARQRAQAAALTVEFRLEDLTACPDLGGPYDFVYDRGAYHCLRRESLPAFLALLERVTRPGALWLNLSGSANEPSDEGPPKVSEAEIRSELGCLFDIHELREFQWEPSEAMPSGPLGWSTLMRRKEA